MTHLRELIAKRVQTHKDRDKIVDGAPLRQYAELHKITDGIIGVGISDNTGGFELVNPLSQTRFRVGLESLTQDSMDELARWSHPGATGRDRQEILVPFQLGSDHSRRVASFSLTLDGCPCAETDARLLANLWSHLRDVSCRLGFMSLLPSFRTTLMYGHILMPGLSTLNALMLG